MEPISSSAPCNNMVRVPLVTLIFWIIKTLSTTVGETAADFMSFGLGLGMPVTALLISMLMVFFFILQFCKFKEYVPTIYWSLVVLMSILGTLITDMLVDLAGVSLILLSIVFTCMMICGFFIWYHNEGTLSIHSIDTAKREAYYWIVILLAFALGTGVGDLISEYFSLGYGTALLLFAVCITLVTIAYYFLGLNAVLAFWIAYVLTRPLGASLGDFMIQPRTNGGLACSMSSINIAFFLAISVGVIYETWHIRQSHSAESHTA